jgi:hypothetical protein
VIERPGSAIAPGCESRDQFDPSDELHVDAETLPIT